MTKFIFPMFETSRLFLRELTIVDNREVWQHFSDEEVTRYMDIPACRSLSEAEEIIQYHLEDSGCRWGVFDKQSKQLAGTCGYHCWVTGAAPRAEIGFDLSKVYWGQGLMTEALQPVIRFGFEQMRLARIEATVDPMNSRSMHLLDSLGFQREAELKDNLECFYKVNNT